MSQAASPGRATSAWMQAESARIASLCTACGNCVRACPMLAYAPVAAAAETGADTVVTIFHSCHREFVALERKRSIQVRNWLHLLAQSIGWDCTDDDRLWRNAEDPRAAIGHARIEEAGAVAFSRLTEPELRRPALL